MDDVIRTMIVAAVAAGLGALYYVYAVYLRPWKDCSVCGGTAKNRGGIFKKTFTWCTACAGNGRQLRLLRKQYEKRHPGKKLEWGKKQ